MKTAINNVKIFDGSAVIKEKGAILFDETGILEVGKGPYEADRVIDGTGKTATPGLIDGHVHMGMTGLSTQTGTAASISLGAQIAAQAQYVWQFGITTLCNCGINENADIIVRNLIREGAIPGARIIACGKGISITGGHAWVMCHQCDDEAAVLTATRAQIRDGADYVKLFATGGRGTKGSDPNQSQLTPGQMKVASEEARHFGRFTRAHATGLAGAKLAIKAGVKVIDHTLLDEEAAQLLKEYGACFCPTIIPQYLALQNPAMARAKENVLSNLEGKKRAVSLCQKYGVTILAGTDSMGGNRNPIGKALWTEMHIYQEYGMSPTEVLRAATGDAAKVLEIDDVTGSLKAGLAADIALFDGDPTKDADAVSTLSMTFQGGKQVYTAVK